MCLVTTNMRQHEPLMERTSSQGDSWSPTPGFPVGFLSTVLDKAEWTHCRIVVLKLIESFWRTAIKGCKLETNRCLLSAEESNSDYSEKNIKEQATFIQWMLRIDKDDSSTVLFHYYHEAASWAVLKWQRLWQNPTPYTAMSTATTEGHTIPHINNNMFIITTWEKCYETGQQGYSGITK